MKRERWKDRIPLSTQRKRKQAGSAERTRHRNNFKSREAVSYEQIAMVLQYVIHYHKNSLLIHECLACIIYSLKIAYPF